MERAQIGLGRALKTISRPELKGVTVCKNLSGIKHGLMKNV